MTSGMKLRDCTIDDAKLLFDWVNSPDSLVQKQTTTAPISWGDHLAWLSKRLGDPTCRISIVEFEGQAAGQVRLWGPANAPAIDIYVAPRWRGHGLAKRALAQCIRDWWDRFGPGTMHAVVRVTNEASRATFKSLGFIESARDSEFIHLQYASMMPSQRQAHE